MAWSVARMVDPILGIHGLLVHFFFSSCINSQKHEPQKRLDHFDVRKVRETQKYIKQGFLLCRIKYQINGEFVEHPQNQCKTRW
jgi:hypothetical protein